MIDFSQLSSGQLGTIIRFTDIFTAALAHKLSGQINIQLESGLFSLAFDDGNPIHVGCTDANDKDRLGLILIETTSTPEAAVDAALAVQAQHDEGEGRARLGAILLEFGDASEQDIKQAILLQTARRLATLFGIEHGDWTLLNEPSPIASEVGSPMQGWPFLLPALKYHASENEMRDVSEALLGKSVKIRGQLPNLDTLGFEDADKELIKLIQKPRKPDQLERVIKDRRSVRAVLKLLGLCGNLELLPVKEGIAIASAVRIKMPKSSMPLPRPVDHAAAQVSSSVSDSRPRKRPASAVRRRAVVTNSPLANEIRKMHKQVKSLNYFQMLDVREDTSSREVRMRYTTLAKKFHPDALGPNQPDDVMSMAREVSAILNDAYATLEDNENRKKYLARLHGTGHAASGQDEGQVESARVKFEMGNSLLRKGDFKRARDYFHFAMANDGNNGIYKAFYAWSIFADRSRKRSEAMETAYPIMRTAAKVCPDHVNVQFYAGKVFQSKGDMDRASAAFERVLELQAGHDGARSALRAIKSGEREEDLPKDKPQSAKEKLSKLFKR